MDLDQVECLKNLSYSLSQKSPYNPIIDFITFLSFFSQGTFSINWKDSFGRTPLHNAVMKGEMTTVDLFMASANNNSYDGECLNLNQLDNDYYSPLGIALREEK